MISVRGIKDLSTDEQTRRLLYDRAALMRQIVRCDRDLRNVHWIFFIGLGVVLFGLFLLWLVSADVTLYTMGRTRYVADPVSFGMSGVFFAVLGVACLIGSVHIGICYPSKLHRLRHSLRDLEDLLVHQRVFPADFRELLGKSYHVYYEDYVKEVRRIRSAESLRKSLGSYIFALCVLFAGLFVTIKGVLEGQPSEAVAVGGLFSLAGAVWALWKYRKNKRAH